MITTQKELRAEFWRQHPQASRRMIPAYSGKGQMYVTDTRVAWCDFLDYMQRAGEISESLASRATLQPAQVSYEWDIQGNYGRAWETENTEITRADALRSLREYRANGSGSYRMKIRRVYQSAGE